MLEAKIEETLAKLKDANDDEDDFDDLSSEASGAITRLDVIKPEPIASEGDPEVPAKTSELKNEAVPSDDAVKSEAVPSDDAVKSEAVPSDDAVKDCQQPQTSAAGMKLDASGRIIEGMCTSPADDTLSQCTEDSMAIDVDSDDVIAKPDYKPRAAGESQFNHKLAGVAGVVAEIADASVKEEKIAADGSESTVSAKSEAIELDDVKVDPMSDESRSASATPKTEVDNNGVDIDSSAIEKMLHKQEKFDFVVDVSDSMTKRDHYPKVRKPPCKLDSLLERRQRQHKMELQQKQILDAVLLRCRVQAIQKKRFAQELADQRQKERECLVKTGQSAASVEGQSAAKKPRISSTASDSETDSDIEMRSGANSDDDDAGAKRKKTTAGGDEESMDDINMNDVGMGKSAVELSIMSQYGCYSASCRRDGATSDVTHAQCYSPLCALYRRQAEAREQGEESLCAHDDSALGEGILDPLTGEIRVPPAHAKATDSKVAEIAKHDPVTANQALDKDEILLGGGGAAAADAKLKFESKHVQSTPADLLSLDKKRSEKEAEARAVKLKYSIQQRQGNTFMMHGERFNIIEQTDDELHSKAKKMCVTYDAMNLTNFTHAGKLSLPPSIIPELEVKSFICGKTQYQFSLVKPARGRGVARSKLVLKKGCIPNIHSFRTSSGHVSLLLLERFELRTLARTAGRREVNGFRYDCKTNNVLWPYQCPRPRMKTCWKYRTRRAPSIAAVALQLRLLWASLRWDDLHAKAPPSGENTVTTDDEIRKKEIVDRREVGPHGLRSQFLVREIVIPLNIANEEPVRGTINHNVIFTKKKVGH